MSVWNPDKKDIEIVCDALMSDFAATDTGNSLSRGGCLYCIHCGEYEVSNGGTGSIKHETDCPILVAQDIMTGFD